MPDIEQIMSHNIQGIDQEQKQLKYANRPDARGFGQKRRTTKEANLFADSKITKESRAVYDNKNSFYMLKKPVECDQAIISAVEDRSISRHILVCGIRTGINTFVRPLRAKSL